MTIDFPNTSIFPLNKRFKDIRSMQMCVLLNEDFVIHEKSFRLGTVFSIIGWKEIHDDKFLIMQKGSWEGLVSVKTIALKLDKIE